MPLTDTHIRGLKPEAKPRKYFDGGGLFLYVPINGSKLWRMAYRYEGKSKLLSFGDYPTVSLKDARHSARKPRDFWQRALTRPNRRKTRGKPESSPSATALKISPWTGIKQGLQNFPKNIREQPYIV